MYMYMYVSEQIQRVGECTCILLHPFYLAYFCLYFGKDILCIDASLGNIIAADLQHNITHDHNQYHFIDIVYLATSQHHDLEIHVTQKRTFEIHKDSTKAA